MSVSKSIRKKRRQSKKRNMRGGGLPDRCALLSYNTSFVLSMAKLFGFPASESTSIYIRLMKLKALMGNTDTPEVFITNYYGKLFIMSCKIIDAFFIDYRKDYDYCVAALQEMNPTKHYLTTMQQNIASKSLTILASAVSINGGTGLAYVIPSDTLNKFSDKLEYEIPTEIQKLKTSDKKEDKEAYDKWFKSRDNKEWFSFSSDPLYSKNPLYNDFTAQKVAIVDLGEHQLYRANNFYKIFKDGVGTPDNGRPMSLIVREESNHCYTLHFNCHIPNPSALKLSPSYTQSILEKYSAGEARYMATWATITREIINEEAAGLLLRFFTPQQLTRLTPDNCRIIFSGDFNDGTGMLMNLMRTAGLTVAGSRLVDIRILFYDCMPKSCCSNFNSVTNSGIKNTPPLLKLVDIETQKNSPTTDPLLATLLKSTDTNLNDHNYIVDTDNYAFVGDGTGSNISLVSEIYNPVIASGITIDYLTLTSNHIRASDHMPVISYTPSEPVMSDAPSEPVMSDARSEPVFSDAPSEPVMSDARSEPVFSDAPSEPVISDAPSGKTQKRRRDYGMDYMTNSKDARIGDNVPEVLMGDGDEDLGGGYKKKNKSQRKSKRYTKKRKYKKSKRR